MTENNIAPFYLCTGFHRSGTSLLAQSLAQGGMFMGSELMGASFSNPLGHVEDMPVVRLHDKIFDINGADWRYANQSPLVIPQWFIPYIQRYIADSIEDREICGVKDPRAALFLEQWEQAAEGNIRYILVYRHWASSCFSILNRASKHLINSTAPLPMNKVNLSFWQQPELAFTMWQANNEAILDFYLRHQDKCLLIAQDAFVNNNDAVAEKAVKIGLDASFFNNAVFEPHLMTDTVPDYFYALLSNKYQQQLDDTWQRLQQAADIRTENNPAQKNQSDSFDLAHLGFVEHVAESKKTAQATYNITSLDWQEALGFTSQIPQESVTSSIFDSLMRRPFTHSDHYQALAKITHKNQLYLYTKLCKMRAMQIEQGSWQVAKWGVFAQPQGAWLQQADETLEQTNPFSLRFKEDLESAIFSDSDIAFIQSDWESINRRLNNVVGPIQLARLLQMLLLYRYFEHAEEYESLAQVAQKSQLWLVAEFALIKALRFEYQASLVMALGDIYNTQGMWVKAYQCFDEANKLNHNQAPIIARLADVCLSLGDRDKAKKLLLTAQQLAPQHKIVELCQKRMTQWVQTDFGSTSSITANSNELLVMPKVERYQDIVDLTRQDRKAGEDLDKYNQQVSFILRDNKRWLVNGLKSLRQPAARSLVNLIYKNWLKLWPEATLKNALNLPNVATKPYDFVSKKSVAPLKLAIVVHMHNQAAITELVAFIDGLPYHADILLTCTLTNKSLVEMVFKNYARGEVLIEAVGDHINHLQAWLNYHESKLGSYELVCKIHDVVVEKTRAVSNWRLQQLFCLLEPNRVEKIVGRFKGQTTLGMVVPGYHPEMASTVINEDRMQYFRLLAKDLQLPQPSTGLAFPVGGMFWYRPKALQLEQQKLDGLLDSDSLLPLLPVILAQHDYQTTCTHLL
jgi:tetratricopeptide (TPR) repeat protein